MSSVFSNDDLANSLDQTANLIVDGAVIPVPVAKPVEIAADGVSEAMAEGLQLRPAAVGESSELQDLDGFLVLLLVRLGHQRISLS